MGFSKASGASLSLKTGNKLRRKQMYIEDKKASGKARHEARHARRREEAKNPELKKERLEKNQPTSIDKKRIWDDVDDDSLGAVVDLAQLKRRRLEQAEAAATTEPEAPVGDAEEENDDEVDSMLGSDDEGNDDEEDEEGKEEMLRMKRAQRQPSAVPSTTSTNLDLTPDSLTLQFKHLFSDEPPPMPKILVTTSINATIHKEAQDIAAVFPNSTYIRRSGHRFSHKYSIREIAKFAKSRLFSFWTLCGGVY